MAKKIYDRWPGYTLEDCDCRYCLYYGGKRRRKIQCLVDECICKEELRKVLSKERREQENGSKDKQGNP